MPLNLPFIAGQTDDPKQYEIWRSMAQQATKSQDFASTYPVTLTRGTPGTPLTHGLSSPLKWPINDLGGQVFNVKAYGAKGDGNTDDTAAINAAITAAGLAGGGTVYFPPGTYCVVQSGSTVPFVINYSNVWITGSARHGTTILFKPSGGGAVFQFNSGAVPINFNGIERLLFKSTDTATQKTAILAYDLNNFIVREIAMSDNEWKGGSSVGVYFRGRQELRMRDCEIYSDLPVVIDENPNLSGANEISFDHSSVTNSDLVVTAGLNNASITIKDSTVLTNSEFRNLALVRGAAGISANSTTPATAWQSITIANCRSEQTNSSAGYTIDIRHSAAQVQNLVIDNFTFDPGMNAIRLTGAHWPSVRSVSYGGTGTFLNLSSTVDGLRIIDSFYASGGTITDSSTNPSCTNLINGTNAPITSFGSLSSPVMVNISSAAPSFQMTDTTASAKSLRAVTDANVASFYEAAGAAGDILSLDLTNKRVGIGTTAPSDVLQVVGMARSTYLRQAETSITLSNGDNNNVSLPATGWVAINGPTAAFAITGIAAGSEGQEVVFFNNTGQTMTIKYNSASSSAGNKLLFGEGVDKTLGAAFVWFKAKYSATQSNWIVIGHI